MAALYGHAWYSGGVDNRTRMVVSATGCPGCGRGVVLMDRGARDYDWQAGGYDAACYGAGLPDCPWKAVVPYRVARAWDNFRDTAPLERWLRCWFAEAMPRVNLLRT